jgi:pimeloyl-ACP methyl ester carboxylesterase
MDLHLISGLGADKRIFQKLALPAIFKIHYIEWSPVSENDTISEYCKRLISQIDLSKPFSLIGVSFGGIVALELSKISNPVQTIIISSFSNREELSGFYRVLNKLNLQKHIPVRLLLTPNNLLYRIFGVFHKDGKLLLKNILQDTDPNFFRWAINQLFVWDNKWKPKSFLHIHGTADKILPFRKNMDAIPVEGGAHLMVYSKAEIINRILAENLLIG